MPSKPSKQKGSTSVELNSSPMSITPKKAILNFQSNDFVTTQLGSSLQHSETPEIPSHRRLRSSAKLEKEVLEISSKSRKRRVCDKSSKSPEIVSNVTKKIKSDVDLPTEHLSFSLTWIPEAFENKFIDENGFTICSYNILSEKLFVDGLLVNSITNQCWNRKFRHPLLIEQIKAIKTDFLCLQEVEMNYWDKQLKKSLILLGYEGFIIDGIKGNQDGVATLFNSSKFSLVSNESVQIYEIMKQHIENNKLLPSELSNEITNYIGSCKPVQISVFQRKVPQTHIPQYIIIANCHLQFLKGIKDDVKCMQTAISFSVLYKKIKELETQWKPTKRSSFKDSESCSALKKRRLDNSTQSYENTSFEKSDSQDLSSPNVFWAFCGDFNMNPDNPAYQIARDGYPSSQSIQILKNAEDTFNNKTLIDHFWLSFQHNVPDVRSCYKEAIAQEPLLTTHLSDNSGCVDYIWYGSNNLSPHSVMQPASQYMQAIGVDCLPNVRMPSDHCPIAAQLMFGKTS